MEITVTLLWEDWKGSIEKAVQELGKDLAVSGFRPGKAPRNIVEKAVGLGRILEKAAEFSIEKTYVKIVAEEKLDVLGAPKAEILKLAEGNDLEYRIVTAVMPVLTLKSWREAIKKINKEKKAEAVTVSTEEVEAEIKKIATSRAALITVNRPAQKGDSVTVDFQVLRDGVPIENGTSKNHPLVLGSGMFIPGFEEQLIGLEAGAEKSFELNFPKEYHAQDLAGKPATFKVKVGLVQERQLPEINDEFAKSVGKFENLQALQANFQEGITKEREAEKKEGWRNALIEKLIALSEVDLPEVLVHQEIHKMIDEFSGQVGSMGLTLEQYLEKIKKSLSDLEKEWQPQAEKRVKAALVLEKVVAEMEIKVPAEKIEAEMNRTLQYYKSVRSAEEKIDLERLYNYTKKVMENEEVLSYLEKLA